MNHRALCVTVDPQRRRDLRRSLHAVGWSIEFATPAALAERVGPTPDLLVLDQAGGEQIDLARVGAQFGAATKIVVLGAVIERDPSLSLMRQLSLDHVIADGASSDDDELVVTTVKLARGDIFGIEKYLAWGVRVEERAVTGYEDKREALDRLVEHTREAGARGQLVSRIETVADELLMNGLYDAPAARNGTPARVGSVPKGAAPCEPVVLRYACDGRYFAISVLDHYGELTKASILDSLARARAENGSPRQGAPEQGAGLGLYMIMGAVTRFIVNVEPRRASEVICMFDLRAKGRDATGCARSVHVFTANGARAH